MSLIPNEKISISVVVINKYPRAFLYAWSEVDFIQISVVERNDE